MLSEDIEFCCRFECTNKKCERHPSRIRQKWFDHSFMDLRGILCKDWQTAEKYGWKCPYNSMRCNTWDCENCEQEQNERSKTMGKLIDVNAFKARLSAGLVYQGADVLEALKAFDEVYQRIYDHHYEILKSEKGERRDAKLSLSNWVLDLMTEYDIEEGADEVAR